jgi:acetyl esterase/lipase
MKRSTWAVVIFAVTLATVAPSMAGTRLTYTCLTGTAPLVAGDLAQITAVRALVNATCPCANFDGTPGKGHLAYNRCAAYVVNSEIALGHLRRQCGATVKGYGSKSICGTDPHKHTEPCVTKSRASGKVACSIVATTTLSGERRAVCQSDAQYVRSLCAYDSCIAAGDTNDNGLLDSGDSGQCAVLTSLVFPKNNYTVETTTVTTSEGTKQVTYNFYNNIVYVANPVDAIYESLNVSVPVNIDGVDVDATNAPILLDINAVGYMSLSTWDSANLSTNGQLALAAGYVVVSPGCRGWNNVSSDGTYYGKAPAAIVDLKSAVRYIRSNSGTISGNVNWIISSGISAGGALSALLGASGNSDLYIRYFEELDAAAADDSIFAVAAYCPITNLDHADMSYEWELGSVKYNGSEVDQTVSGELQSAFETYQDGLALTGDNSFGTITAANFKEYILETYLIPSANKYLSSLSSTALSSYLSSHTWITWNSSTGEASFSYSDYVNYIGRSKGLPAFDAFFDIATTTFTGENTSYTFEVREFGDSTTKARHFTNFSLQYTSGDPSATISSDLQTIVNMMNPMYFVGQKNSGCADYWWIRHGTKDTDTSRMVYIDLGTSLENLNKTVNTWLYWDAGHGVNEDPEEFIAWIGNITGYTKRGSGPN